MTDAFVTLARARQIATGSPLDIDPPNLESRCDSEAELDGLITDFYTFFNETLSREVGFLERQRPNSQIRATRSLIYNLRTARHHADNPEAERVSALWRSQYSSSQDAANALSTDLKRCLEVISAIAVAVSRNPDATAKWRELLAVDVTTVFSAVATDLGLRFTEGNRSRMVRLVETRLRIQPGRGDRRLLVAEYCAQQILADRRALPVPYDHVLDVLQLIGTTRAPGAILVAHSVAEISPGLDGDAFIARVEETWRAATAQ